MFARPRPMTEPVVPKPADGAAGDPDPPPARVIAVTGGAGSPGRTTVAINLAAALGAAASTVLVEADLCAPALAAYLDRDPSRNLCTLAHAVREDARAWDAALADELQPLSHHSPSASVLCGPPKHEMRASIAPAFLERLIAELKRRHRYVVIDVGPELLGIDAAAANHRAVLASAQQVIVVAAADLVGLWHARTALNQLERQLSIEPRTANLLLNRHDSRYHHAQTEVEWHLGAPVAAVVPFDHHGVQRALAEQRPLVVDPNSRASRALLSLAERIYDGKLQLPAEPGRPDRAERGWRTALRRRLRNVSKPRLPERERLPVALARERGGRAW
jgi:MinD-like ATPase involved in chromosome partitioning or flagellar assembly